MSSGEIPNSSEREQSVEAERTTYGERGRKVLESISLSELAAIDIKSLSDQELEDLNNRLKADIEAGYKRLGIERPSRQAPEAAAEPEEVAEPEPVAEAEPESEPEQPAEAETVIPVPPVVETAEPEEILEGAPEAAAEAPEAEAAAPEEAEEVAEAEPAAVETIPTEKAEATYEKAKKKSGFKNFLKKTFIPVALAALVAFGFGVNTANKADAQPQDSYSPVQTEQSIDAEEVGIIDGYDEQGMWESDSKAGPYNFAYAPEVAEACDNDECEMIKYTANNQVESFADYLANLPEELQPEGFKGLSILETEAKLESLSDEEYEAVQSQFNGVIDQGFTRDHVLDGQYHNAYMKLKDPNGGITHENMDLVNCVTTEDNYRATEVYWTDDGTANGNVVGSMIIKIVRGDDGSIVDGCMQVVNPDDTVYVGMPTITPDHPGDPTPEDIPEPEPEPEPTPEPEPEPEPTPTPTPEPEPEPTPEPKDPDNLERIDENINEDIAEDIGTDHIDITPTPTEEVESQTPTEQPSGSDYQGTEATTVQNDTSTHAEPVQQQVSQENNYSNDNGGSHQSEYKPVQSNTEAQQSADKAEVSQSQAPSTAEEAEDTLKDLGIE